MVLKDRRNKSYDWLAKYNCPQCKNKWYLKMEFNNGRDFIIDDFNDDESCPECGTKGEQLPYRRKL